MSAENEVEGIYKDQFGKYVWVLGEENGLYFCKGCENGISYYVNEEQFKKFVFFSNWENE